MYWKRRNTFFEEFKSKGKIAPKLKEEKLSYLQTKIQRDRDWSEIEGGSKIESRVLFGGLLLFLRNPFDGKRNILRYNAEMCENELLIECMVLVLLYPHII